MSCTFKLKKQIQISCNFRIASEFNRIRGALFGLGIRVQEGEILIFEKLEWKFFHGGMVASRV
jgi:hypothetical protein